MDAFRIRDKIIRAIYLRRNWTYPDGPLPSQTLTLPCSSKTLNLRSHVRLIPQTNLALVLDWTRGALSCIDLEADGRMLWSRDTVEEIIRFDFEVVDDGSALHIAMRTLHHKAEIEFLE